MYNPITFLVILYPKPLANLVVEVGIRHSHLILLTNWTFESKHLKDFNKIANAFDVSYEKWTILDGFYTFMIYFGVRMIADRPVKSMAKGDVAVNLKIHYLNKY